MISRAIMVCVAASAIISLSACDRRTPRVSEETLNRVRSDWPGITDDCLDKLRFGGIDAAMPSKTDECFKMEPPRHWRGLWADYFEGQQFCPAPAKDCQFDEHAPRIWLSFAKDQPRAGQPPGMRVYQVEFIGRRTLRPGHYGHMAAYTDEVIVDRLISIVPVSQPDSSPPDKARQ
jgi:hypothetical protein